MSFSGKVWVISGVVSNLPWAMSAKNLSAVAAVHPAGFEGEVFAVHIGQRQHLGPVVKGHHRDSGVGPGTLPGHPEAVVAPRHLQHHVGASVVAVLPDIVGQSLRWGGEYLRVVGADKVQPLLVQIADNDPPGVLELDALEGAQAGGACAQNQHRVPGLNFRDLGGPIAGGQHIPHQQRLEIGDPVGYLVQSLVGMGYPDIFRLAPVDATAQGPAPVRVGAVIDPAVLAEEAVAAEGFHIHRHPVTGPDRGDGPAHLVHDAHHLMAHGDPGHRPGHRAVLDVQVTGADAAQRHFDDGVPIVQQYGLGLFHQFKQSLSDIGIGEHIPNPFPALFPGISPLSVSRGPGSINPGPHFFCKNLFSYSRPSGNTTRPGCKTGARWSVEEPGPCFFEKPQAGLPHRSGAEPNVLPLGPPTPTGAGGQGSGGLCVEYRKTSVNPSPLRTSKRLRPGGPPAQTGWEPGRRWSRYPDPKRRCS